MRFYLSIIIILITLAVGLFLGGTSIGIILNPSEWVLISGIAIGSFIMGNQRTVLKHILQQLSKIISEKPYVKNDYLELLAFLFAFFKHSSTATMAELEKHIENPEKSDIFLKYPILLKDEGGLRFFCDHIRVLTLGFNNVQEIAERMDADLLIQRKTFESVTKSLNRLGDALPAFGIVAAVLGVISAMASAGASPEILGARVAAALVGTFAGVFIAYCIVNPFGSFIEKFNDDEIEFLECIKVGILGHIKGYPASITIEFARQSISSSIQPTFHELEASIYTNVNQ